MSPRSRRALESLRDLLERVLAGSYELEVVDIYQEPDEARRTRSSRSDPHQSAPSPVKVLVGDMSDTRRLLIGLDIELLERHGRQDANRPTTEDEALRARLEVAEETLAAIRAGTVDALVVDGREGRRVYTLDGANQVYRALVEHIEEGACALTPAGVVLFCNGALARLLGRPLRSVTGHPLRELLAAESRDRLAALIAEANAGRPVRGELVLESPTAGKVPVAIALTPFRAFGEASLAGSSRTCATRDSGRSSWRPASPSGPTRSGRRWHGPRSPSARCASARRGSRWP